MLRRTYNPWHEQVISVLSFYLVQRAPFVVFVGAGQVKREIITSGDDGRRCAIDPPRIAAETTDCIESATVPIKMKCRGSKHCRRQDAASAAPSPVAGQIIAGATAAVASVGMSQVADGMGGTDKNFHPEVARLDPTMLGPSPPTQLTAEGPLSARPVAPPHSQNLTGVSIPTMPPTVAKTTSPVASGQRGGGQRQSESSSLHQSDQPTPSVLPATPASLAAPVGGAPAAPAGSNFEAASSLLSHQRRYRTCMHAGCLKRPSFGNQGSKATWCGEHKKEGMKDVSTKRCRHPSCDRIPSFRYPTEKGSQFCAAHKKSGMIDYHHRTRRCRHPGGCNSSSSFGFEGQLRTACSLHRKEGMFNKNVRACHASGCSLTPTFAARGESPRSCARHKQEGMVNVVTKRCQHPDGCDRIPSYGREEAGQKSRAIFCKAHKADDMVNVRHPRCAEPDCRRQPSFGPAGGKKAFFCKEHKAPAMVDVVNKRS